MINKELRNNRFNFYRALEREERGMLLKCINKTLRIVCLVICMMVFGLQSLSSASEEWTCTVEAPRPDRRGKPQSPATAYVWIPEGVKVLRGAVVAGKISLERSLCTDPVIREACKEKGLAVIYYEPHLAAVFPYAENNGEELFLSSLEKAAKASGHPELAYVPWLTAGHSTGGIFCRNVAFWKPGRVIGIIHIKSGNFQDHIQDQGGTIAGVPFLAINGEFEEFGPAGGDLRGGKRAAYSLEPKDKSKYNQTQWVMIRMQMLERRRRNGDNLMSLVVHRGGGHGGWSDELSKIAAQFIKSAADARLSQDGNRVPGKPVFCTPLTAADGWLTDADIKSPGFEAAPYADYKGDRNFAFWHLDGGLARMINAYHKGPWEHADPTSGLSLEERFRPPKQLQDQVDLARAAVSGKERPALLKDAEKRIRSHRTGDLVIKIKREKGVPVENLKVTVRQLSHDFLFGCNIFALGRLRIPERENRYRAYFDEIFNYATLPFYWANFERRKGQPQYERVEVMAKWCGEKGITVKGHPLVWNHPAGVPAWLPDEPETVRTLLSQRVFDCVRHFRGSIKRWDVVNEAAVPFRFNEKNQISNLMKAIGNKQYLLDAFSEAEKANPDAILLINDYHLGKQYHEVIEMLRSGDGFLCDYIGIQSHMHGGVWPVKRIWDVCERYAEYKMPLHFTETTLVSGPRRSNRWQPTEPALEERQARQAVLFYTMLFSHPAVTALTWWDFSDAAAWQGAAAGFLRKDCTPKPVYHALHRLIKDRWWTHEVLTTDAAGQVKLPAFFGKYVVSVMDTKGKKLKEKTVRFDRPWPSPGEKRVEKVIEL